jgi:hypothetical protein
MVRAAPGQPVWRLDNNDLPATKVIKVPEETGPPAPLTGRAVLVLWRRSGAPTAYPNACTAHASRGRVGRSQSGMALTALLLASRYGGTRTDEDLPDARDTTTGTRPCLMARTGG